ncbi:hypothetical protein HRR83_001438 [Exophiala dermatitidis]|uniref:MFS transporter, MCP family, solute carrier family 16 (Monocarboxylic acid transporters), member 10 n=1 Tax=Exophiala dermatitidis TaxID=5970 RepID=A0AAN6IXW0_EXODE|nr:hypothetical protein HRR75_001327 [Exophiala dermatitidis]KAJ4526247.1 hypothetical protein HRR74_001442 [Exophiala dermatitidis]KAJ4546971.1 hypothetical protein HRR77_004511 [Exophiala dermatitidis]KAJ4559898.1 hypothetical protein HRR78_000420 [Exophiala dermatitidis]KAJ4584084.1 hypothetical protein HRR82_003416 [Exophiala dermatitidis]
MAGNHPLPSPLVEASPRLHPTFAFPDEVELESSFDPPGRYDYDSPSLQDREHQLARKKARVLVASAVLQLPIWGFAMSYGVFQEYYSTARFLQASSSRSATGVIGTTSNGVIYLSMPFFFAAFSQRYARYRHAVAYCGVGLAFVSFLLSSFSTQVWHLVATQGVLAALGSALVYSPTTLSLGESFTTHNRAVAYGIVFSCKNIVGSACPFLLRFLLDRYGFRTTMRIWTAVITGSSLGAIFLLPVTHAGVLSTTTTSTDEDRHGSSTTPRPRHTPWHFLKHQTFYIYSIATIMQSSGYGIPQTYLNSYAQNAGALSQTSGTLLLCLFNIPGILSSSFFGYLSDNKWYPLSATTSTWVSSISSALSVFLLWGLAPRTSMAALTLFSIIFGFFASGYSSTWGGVIKQLEHEAADRNEAIDIGVVYGLLNGARGLGYVSGGLAGVRLLKTGKINGPGLSGYGTEYGPLIIFTGLVSIFGGWSVMWKCKGLIHH